MFFGKMILIGLLIAVVGLGSVSAETWAQFRSRANRMSNAVAAALADPGFETGRNHDTMGAVWATHDWLFDAFVSIRDNYPGLSQQERTMYQLFVLLHRDMAEEMEALIIRADARTFNAIRSRHTHWFNHLRNGGIINFR